MVSAIVSAAPATCQRRGSDFAELSRAVQQAGLLRRRHSHYAVKCAFTVAVFAAAWFVFGYVGDSWWQLFTAAFLALVSTQLSFIGHDAGHKQIFRGRRANDAVGFVHAGLVGLSYGWWIGKHNRHHANPNHEDDDPDLDIPALAQTKGHGRAKHGFAPTPKGMPTLTEGHTLDLLRKQVLTSRNVRGRRWVDFALGGMNYQIEHSYSQCGLLRSYDHGLHHLHAVGAPLRAAPPSAILSGAPSSHPRSLPVPQQLRSILITGDRKEQ